MPRKCKGSFKMKYNNASFPFKGENHDFLHEGYKIVRKDLDDGIQGEAENGKIINIDVRWKRLHLLHQAQLLLLP